MNSTTSSAAEGGAKQNLAAFFANLNLRRKLLSGFGVVLFVLVVVSTLALINFIYVGNEVEEYAELVEEAALAEELEIKFLKLVGEAQHFARTGEESEVATVRKYGKELTAMVSSAKEMIKDAAHRKLIVEIEEALKTYLREFDEAAALIRRHNQLIREEMLPAGAKVVEDLDRIQDSAVSQGMNDVSLLAGKAREHALLAQVFTLRMVSGEQAFMAKANAEFKVTDKALEELGDAIRGADQTALFDEALSLFKAYEKAFVAVHAELTKIRSLLDVEMPKMIDVVTKDAEELVRLIGEEEEELKADMKGEIAFAEIEMVVIGLLGIAIGIAIALMLGSMISKPVIAMTDAMRQLADGNLDADMPASDSRDEIGEMAATLQVFRDNAREMKRLEAEQKENEKRAETERKNLLMDMADDFQNTVGSVVEGVSAAATEMEASANAMSGQARTAMDNATTVSAASTEASSNVQTVAAATHELTSSIGEISRQVDESARIANAAVTGAAETGRKIEVLADSANKISEVVNLITDIAEQTNLLALNATIEAARAGDAGKGFAVVASEVKNLANQTARATEEIGTQISGIQDATRDSVDAIGQINQTIGQINEAMTGISAAVEEQNAATQEIARNVEEAASGTDQVSENINGVSEAAAETGNASDQILEASKELANQSTLLRDQVEKFVQQVRAG